MSTQSKSQQRASLKQFVIWIDGVGAFRVCAEPVLRLGGLSGDADVRVAGNLAARHATLHREGESYVMDAAHPALIVTETNRKGSASGRVVAERTTVADGDEIVLYQENTTGVRFRFSTPNPLTATSVLTLLSGHRTEPRYDSVIIMGEACLVGSSSGVHVRCKEWPGTIVLFRRNENIFCKSKVPSVFLKGSLNGEPLAEEEGALPVLGKGHYTGPGISFWIEDLNLRNV